MIVILSPAKNMKINKDTLGFNQKPKLLKQTLEIHKILKNLNPSDLESLMKINSELALNTYKNILEFNMDKVGTPAILAYDGLAFKNLDALSFSEEDLIFANDNLYILSGLYGALRALDLILPYRLEMQCKLNIKEHKNLYKFWGDLIYKEVFKTNQVVVNLASDEYSKVITPYLTSKDKFINISFVTLKNGKLKTIATSAKTLRGKMARYIIKNRIKNIEDLKQFTFDGYNFDSYLSTLDNYFFVK